MATERFGIFNLPLYPEGPEVSDFRPVPESDNGEKYTDRGQRGTFAPSADPYRTPSDVKMFAGYGADEADLERGFCEPLITDAPAYNLSDYKLRSTQPMERNVDMGETDVTEADWEFRARNTRSKGFLTRPHIPTERS